MIFTARQLQQMHKANGGGQIVLPYQARLTPLARDFLKAKKIEVGYSDNSRDSTNPGPGADDARLSDASYIWWSDGPCGAGKAAIVAQGRESALTPLPVANDEQHLVPAIQSIAREIKMGRASGAVVLVQTAARAALFANRCPSIRAVLGTCMDAVEQGVSLVAANMLIIEYPYKTFPQIRNLLSRFVRGNRKPSPEIEQQLKEMAGCA